MHSGALSIYALKLIFEPEMLPALQRDGDVSIEPNVVVKCTQIEFVTPFSARLGEKAHDLCFSYLV